MQAEYYVKVVGGIDVDTNLLTLKNLFMGLDGGTIITLPPWLQRKLQKEEWFKNKYKKPKSYFYSAVTGTLKFEPFAFVPVSLLLNELQSQLVLLDNDEEKIEVQRSIDYIKNHTNAVYVIIDGQSRGYLSIVKFFTNEIGFDRACTIRKYETETDNIIEEYNLKNRKFKVMPDWVQNYIFNLEIIQNTITAGNLSEIVKALISKQMGVRWEKFQMVYAEFAFSNIFTRLRRGLKKPIESFYQKRLKDIAIYQDDVNGLEFSLTNWLLYLRDKSFPNIEKIIRTCEYKDITPSASTYKRFIGYLDEYRQYWTGVKSTKKVKLKFWYTYAAFRDILDNGNSSDNYYTSFGVNDSFNIHRSDNFCEWFTKVDSELWAKVSKDAKFHWEKVTLPSGKSKFMKVEGGYPASYGGDSTDLIKDRLYWIVEKFNNDKQTLINDGTITVNKTKPSMNDIMLANDGKDADGNDIDYRKKYDKGHVKPVSKTGDNSIENFVPQNPTDNKEYSDTELIV